MQSVKPSASLFRPIGGELLGFSNLPGSESETKIHLVSEELKQFFNHRYPCVAGLRAYRRGEYQIGHYGELGQAREWRSLRKDLEFFAHEQIRTRSNFLTFFAAFDYQAFNEDEFETAMWRELSFLSSVEEREIDWRNSQNSDPNSTDFRMSIGGSEFFVVGLHEKSSRMARRFKYPTLVFNLFSQFDELQRSGVYDGLVKTIRDRDEKLQGTVNPMAAEHGEKWESIQFSGKANSKEWKCPFHLVHQNQKP